MAGKQQGEGGYADMKLDELRERAKELEIGGVWDMDKAQLVAELERREGEPSTSGSKSGSDESERSSGGVSLGDETSDSVKYSQTIESPDEHEERPGRSLVTRNHEVIRNWADARGAVPGTEHDEHLGVLRFDFPGYGGESLEHVDWDRWFETFDERKLNFIYQEHKTDASDSNFFRLENPDRESA